MDTENIPLDMNAVFSSERSNGFNLSSMIKGCLGSVSTIDMDKKFFGSIEEKYLTMLNHHNINDVEEVVKAKIGEFKEANPLNSDNAKEWGANIGILLESVLFSYASDHLDSRYDAIYNMLSIMANCLLLLPYSNLKERFIPEAFGEVAGNVSSHLDKQRSLKSRKKDIEEFLRAEGIIHG